MFTEVSKCFHIDVFQLASVMSYKNLHVFSHRDCSF